MKQNFFVVLFCASSLTLSTNAAEGPYHFIKEIPVGGESGWDYLSVDPAGHRLYVTHGLKVVVIDTSTEQVVGEVTDTPGVHGFAIAPDLGKGFSSNGREAKASIVDLKTLKTLSKVSTGENPDSILYEPVHKEVYTFNGRGRSATVFEAESGKVVTTIPLPGKPEFAVEDPKAERIYNNLEDKSVIVVIDAKEHKVIETWPLAPGEGPSGLAIDLEHHRLFAGCGDSKTMVMLDSSNGKIMDKVTIGDGVDANAFDPQTHLAFASCGDGTVTIAQEDGDKLKAVQTLKTAPSARTMTIDPSTHRIYLAAAKYEGQGENPRRGKMVAGSFKILVYGTDK